MSKVSRAICYQVGALVLAIALGIALSRFIPVVNFIEALQQRVMNWGAWAAICSYKLGWTLRSRAAPAATKGALNEVPQPAA